MSASEILGNNMNSMDKLHEAISKVRAVKAKDALIEAVDNVEKEMAAMREIIDLQAELISYHENAEPDSKAGQNIHGTRRARMGRVTIDAD
jgi:hypothetical protein